MVARERASAGGLDGIEIAFDDERLVADAGWSCRRRYAIAWAPRE